MPEPRIFMLGSPGWEESLEYYERRHGEPLDPSYAERAVELAPGVRVFLLSTGGGISPDGQVRTFGAHVAVWDDRQGSDYA
jgi:hypothetical protein